MPPKKKRGTIVEKSSYVRTENWGGFAPGDPIKLVSGFLSTRQKQHWVFRCHVLNPISGKEWIEIFGGTRQDPDSIRAVKPDEIQLIKSNRKK